eukprot:scaffold9993_cov101-Isochrysis_galbana.AAC.7
MSISSYASDPSAASSPHSYDFSLSDKSRQSGMVQPVVNEMFATVHAAGSSLLGLFTSCTTFDSTFEGLVVWWCGANDREPRQGLVTEDVKERDCCSHAQIQRGGEEHSWEGVIRKGKSKEGRSELLGSAGRRQRFVSDM